MCGPPVLRRKSTDNHRGTVEPKQPDTHDHTGQRLVNIDGQCVERGRCRFGWAAETTAKNGPNRELGVVTDLGW